MVAYGCSIHIILVPIIFLFIFSLFYLSPFSSNNNIPNILSFPTNNNSRHENHLSLSIAPALSPFPNNPNSTVLVMTVDNQRPKKEISRLERIEQDLARARAEIQKAVKSDWINCTSNKEIISNFISEGTIYRNAHSFYQSHIEMSKRFKIWIYREGDQPLVHGGPLNNIYGIEGQFIDEMESEKSHFIARHPDEAHAFFIPISVVKIVNILYKPIVTYSREQLQSVVEDYIRVVADKYPYWNRSSGADHFLVSCHDWAPDISAANPKFFNRFIRVLCNANTSEGFNPQRDVSIPEINIPVGKLGPNPQTNSPNKRNILAFFAGGAHGYIRNLLLQQWKNKDNEVQVHEYLKRKQNYFKLMGSSKFCLCPSGYEVASPRIVTAIVVGCVPVIISDNYTLPFSDVLKWSKFSIHIRSEKIPKLKMILQRVSDKRYLQMQERLIQVQKHFVINRPAKPYDMIHMLLHSVWLRRLNIRLHN